MPAPFSKPQQVVESTSNSEYLNTYPSQSTGYLLGEEGVSAVQQHIDLQSKVNFTDDEHFKKDENIVEESFDLKLNTTEDYKRAFIHTLIFERKY